MQGLLTGTREGGYPFEQEARASQNQMRWQTLFGLLLVAGSAGSAYYTRDIWMPPQTPWPPYAPPQAECGEALTDKHEGAAIRFRYPYGWRVSERPDPVSGMIQTFLAPPDGNGQEVTLFLREPGAQLSTVTVPPDQSQGAPGGQPLRDAPASPSAGFEQAGQPPAPAAAAAAADAARVEGSEQGFTLDANRHGNAYLTRTDHPDQTVSHSWMGFIWDAQGRMAIVSGPMLFYSNWPPQRNRNRMLNCAYWEVLKTVAPK